MRFIDAAPAGFEDETPFTVGVVDLTETGRLLAWFGETIAAAQAPGCAENVKNISSSPFAAIGGAISTNAGGNSVIRYGMMREQVLGLEAVLADGTVLNSLRALRKDTAGYDLKQLFIGSEGTLGIITAAVLRLFPDPGERSTALVGIASSGAAVGLLARLKEAVGDRIESFELLPRRIFELVATHVPDAALPFADAFTTWAGVLTTFLVVWKVLENWVYWFVIDSISIFLYIDRGLYLTALLFAAYVVIVAFSLPVATIATLTGATAPFAP